MTLSHLLSRCMCAADFVALVSLADLHLPGTADLPATAVLPAPADLPTPADLSADLPAPADLPACQCSPNPVLSGKRSV